MNKILVEGEKGHGYIDSKIPRLFRTKKSNLIFKAGQEPLPFDWQKGYNVETDLQQFLGDVNFKLPVKDQLESMSCGGQAASSLSSVLQAFLTKKFDERSARDIYSHVYYVGGGTTSDRLEKLLLNRGVAREVLVPSQPATEAFMTTKKDTPEVLSDALEAVEEKSVSISTTNIDLIAQSIRDDYGVIVALQGRNGETPSWRSSVPMPPSSNDNLWGHYLFLLGAMAITPTELQGLKDGIITIQDLNQKYGNTK